MVMSGKPWHYNLWQISGWNAHQQCHCQYGAAAELKCGAAETASTGGPLRLLNGSPTRSVGWGRQFDSELRLSEDHAAVRCYASTSSPSMCLLSFFVFWNYRPVSNLFEILSMESLRNCTTSLQLVVNSIISVCSNLRIFDKCKCIIENWNTKTDLSWVASVRNYPQSIRFYLNELAPHSLLLQFDSNLSPFCQKCCNIFLSSQKYWNIRLRNRAARAAVNVIISIERKHVYIQLPKWRAVFVITKGTIKWRRDAYIVYKSRRIWLLDTAWERKLGVMRNKTLLQYTAQDKRYCNSTLWYIKRVLKHFAKLNRYCNSFDIWNNCCNNKEFVANSFKLNRMLYR